MQEKNYHFHFVGIGGIGMSGIAKILLQQGYIVSGCDKNMHQKTIADLKALSCAITEHDQPSCYDPSINVMVYSTDIPQSMPECKEAQKRHIPLVHRSIVLAELMRKKYTIAIAGSHGKTTTSSLTAHIFSEAHLNPSFVVGGFIQSLGTNAHHGTGDFMIVETDESDRSLLNLPASYAILTNIDAEHLNVYANVHDVAHTFNMFLEGLPFYGAAIVCQDDPYIAALLPLKKGRSISYGFSEKADWRISNLVLEKSSSTYQLTHQKTDRCFTVKAPLPGEHNALNSAASLIAAHEAGIPLHQAISCLSSFQGVDRRFSYRGIYKGREIFDDYGHHPTEIACTLKNALRYAEGKPVSLIFQPHRYTRTQALWHEFVSLFGQFPLQHIIITDIYAAHESPIDNISGSTLMEAIKRHYPQLSISYAPYDQEYNNLITSINKHIPESGILLIQGAGPISLIAHELVSK